MPNDSTTATTSPSQPAQAAQPSDVKKAAANVSGVQAVARLLKASEAAKAPAKAEETKATEPKAPETSTTTPAETSTSQSPEAKPESATAPENTTTTEGEAEQTGETDDPVLSPKSQIPQELKETLQKRIDKEVAKRYKLKSEFDGKIAELQKQVESLSAQAKAKPQQPVQQFPNTPIGADPLPDIKSESDLAKLQKDAKDAVRWAEKQLIYPEDEREQVTVDGKQIQPTDKYLKMVAFNARSMLDDQIPTKREIFQRQAQIAQARNQFDAKATEDFPYLADEKSAEYNQAQQFIQSVPWLNEMPGGKYIVGAYIKGIKALEAERKAAAEAAKPKEPEAKPAPKVAPKAPSDQTPVSTNGTIARISPDAAKRNSVSGEFEKLRARKGVTARDAAEFLKRKELLNS